MSSQCLLASMFLEEKLVVNLIEDPLNITSHISLAAFKILCLSLGFNNLTTKSLGVDFFGFIVYYSLGFLDMYIHVVLQIWGDVSHCLFNVFLPLSIFCQDTYIVNICIFNDISLMLCSFSFILIFSAPQLNNFICLIFKFINAFFCLLKSAG